MKRLLLVISCILPLSAAFAKHPDKLERPKLVVGIVVDQMRWDYLYRYYDRFGEGGFKRMMNKGFNCQNTFINYLPSFTAPGHACIYTGSVPSIHGIAANDWVADEEGANCYCTSDKERKTIGIGQRITGEMSAKNLLVTTITDELRLATNMRSKVFGIALKDRASILPAGHLANGAYWFDDSTGNFVSSNAYGNALPDWLVRFNNKRFADTLMRHKWNLLYPANTYTQSLSDDNPYEGTSPIEPKPIFPHVPVGNGYYGLRSLPAGNTLTLMAAKACINGAQLGQGSATDFLCISFSSTDYVGHKYAPNAMEVEDMYLRLDRDLAELFDYLDEYVGKENYTAFLTADHGGAHNAKYLEDINIPAGNNDEMKTNAELNAALKAKYGKDSLALALTNYQVYLDEKRIRKYNLNRNEINTTIVNFMLTQPEVEYAVDMENIGNATVPEPIRTMIINGYNKQRSGCIEIILKPGWYSGYAPTGTTHGSWNPYDAHIPLLWYGWGIPQGQTTRTVHMTDISATLAALLHIQMPNGCIGETISEITH